MHSEANRSIAFPTHLDEGLKSIIEHFYKWEKKQPNKVFLRQPYGNCWHTITYKEAGQEARKIVTALKKNGLKAGAHIGILSKNCYHWILADLAIMMGGYVSVPYYANLPKNQLSEVIKLSDIKAIFIGRLDTWGEKAEAIPAEVLSIKFPQYKDYAEITTGLEWNKLLKTNAAYKNNFVPDLDSLWTIKFTSGTTGKPKGVMLAHRAPARSMAAEKEKDWVGVLSLKELRCMSYLPLNHVGERIGIEAVVITGGGSISFTESLETFSQNLRDTQPTYFFSVPRLWIKFYQGVIAKFPEDKLYPLLEDPNRKEEIKRQIRTSLGFADLQITTTGAAITPAFLKEFYKKLDIYLLEAYGMTEVCGSFSNAVKPDAPIDSVGKPRPYSKVKIDPDTGEILMRSPFAMLGYYKDPIATAKIIKDGWIHSGDRGEVDECGYLRVIGRVSDSFKSSKGKYIIPNPIEEKLIANEYIEQVCVVGLGIPQPIALINLSLAVADFERDEISKSLQMILEQTNLDANSHEKISALVIFSELWTIENRVLTPTMKVKRRSLNEKYGTRYTDWYEAKGVIWV